MNINWGRVIPGGLLAGLLLNVGEVLLNDIVLGEQIRETFARLGITPPGTSFMIAAVTLTFVVGILLVLLYALIRPRLGPGVKTAIVAGLMMWFGIYVYCGVINGMIFGVPTYWIVITIVWGFFQYLISAVAGAWVYKEA